MKKNLIYALLICSPLRRTSCGKTSETAPAIPSESAKISENKNTAEPSETIHAQALEVQFEHGEAVNGVYPVLVESEIDFTFVILPIGAVETEVVITSSSEKVTINGNKVKFNEKETSDIVLTFTLKGTQIKKELTFKTLTEEDVFRQNLEKIQKSTSDISKKADKYILKHTTNSGETQETHAMYKNEYLLENDKGLRISKQIKDNCYRKFRLIGGGLEEFEKKELNNENRNECLKEVNTFNLDGFTSIYDYLFGDKGLLKRKNGFLDPALHSTLKFTSDNNIKFTLSNQYSFAGEVDSSVTIYRKESLVIGLKDQLEYVTDFTFKTEDFETEAREGTPTSSSTTSLSLASVSDSLRENESQIKESDFYYTDLFISLDSSSEKYYADRSYPLIISSTNGNASTLIDTRKISVKNKDENRDTVVATYNEKTKTIDAKNPGVAVVKVETASGQTQTKEITFEQIPVRAIRINSEGGEIKGGASVLLTAEVLPENAEQGYTASLSSESASLATLEKTDAGYILKANEDVEDNKTIMVIFTSAGNKENGTKATETVSFTTKKKAATVNPIEEKLIGEWSVSEDADNYPGSTLEFRKDGKARVHIADIMYPADFIFDWNKNGNPILVADSAHQLDKSFEYDDDYEEHFAEIPDYSISNLAFDRDNLKMVLHDLVRNVDIELVFIKK